MKDPLATERSYSADVRYRLPSGREFTLTAHQPSEWGSELARRLANLGCTDAYIAQVAADYAAATPNSG